MDALREAVAALDDEDILALCYGLGGSRRQRLLLYQDALRGRGGERAQFASCLICFDLARLGDAASEAQFGVLVDSLRQVSGNAEALAALVAEAPYLQETWRAVAAVLAEADPLALPAAAIAGGEEGPAVAEVALLGDEDLPGLALEPDDKTLWRRFDEAVEAFLGGVIGVPVYDQTAGFRLASRRDSERLEALLLQLRSVGHAVVPARGFHALALLFLGTRLRSRGLFGGVNARKQQLLREGIAEFLAPPTQVWRVVGVLSSMHADPQAWPDIAEVIEAYLCWQMQAPEHRHLGLSGYDPISGGAARGR